MESIEKTILKTAGITFSALLGLIVIFILICSFFFPYIMFKITDNLGMKDTSLYYIKATYNIDKDINTLHQVIYRAISCESDSDIINYSEIMFSDEHYYDFMDYIDEYNKDASFTYLVSLSNEDNYLKNQYVKALIRQNEIIEAKDFAINDFNTLNAYAFEDKINWVLGGMFILEKTSLNYSFLNEPNGEHLLIDDIQIFVENLKSVFDEKLALLNLDDTNLNSDEVLSLVILQYNLINICADIISVKDIEDLDIDNMDYFISVYEELIS